MTQNLDVEKKLHLFSGEVETRIEVASGVLHFWKQIEMKMSDCQARLQAGITR